MGYISEDKKKDRRNKIMIIMTLVPVLMVATTLVAIATIKYSDRFIKY